MLQNLLKSAPLSIDWLVIVRIVLGILIMKHGFVLFDSEAMKGSAGFLASLNIPAPQLMAYVSKSAEFFGGLCLVLGLFTHFAGGVLVFNMFIAIWTAHQFNIFKDGELAFVYLLFFAVFGLLGGGRYSLDHLLFK